MARTWKDNVGHEICPTMAAFSKKPKMHKAQHQKELGSCIVIEDGEKIRQNFIRDSWNEKHGGNV